MSTANLDSADLKGVNYGGLIREDVMEKIWDISKIPLPFTDMIGSGKARNSFREWTTDELAAPDVTNAVVDGADASGNNTATGLRVGNHCQTSDKVVKVSYRADASDIIGRSKELAYQLMRRQQELRRDVEAIALENQASVADDGNSTAGKAGGLPTWIVTNSQNGTAGGFNVSDGLTDVWTSTGAVVTPTETLVRNAVEGVYNEGGESTKLMSIPGITRRFSEYLFTSSARVGTIMSDQGKSREAAAAVGSINIFVTDFGTLDIVPNRLQQKQTAAAANDSAFIFILDPMQLAIDYLYGYRTDVLAKTGLAENRQMAVDWTLRVGNQKAQAMIGDIGVATAWTA